MSADAGSVNSWQCQDCGKLTVAVLVDDGVTPMFLQCRRTPGCKGRAVSAMFPPPPVPAETLELLAYEWYRPTDRWAKRQGPDMRQHVKLGGLVLRELTDAGERALEEAGIVR